MSCCVLQGPEHCYILFLKKLAGCTISQHDNSLWHIQYLLNLQADLEYAEEEGNDDTDLRSLMADKDDGISC
jgi:hypothetical protein